MPAEVAISHLYPRVAYDGNSYCGFLDNSDFMAWVKKCSPHSAIPMECFWTLHQCAKQALNLEGDFAEMGVDRGGSASFLANIVSGSRTLHLFDTFEGMPETDSVRDWHKKGDFSDTSLERVKEVVGWNSNVAYHPGKIPDSFLGLNALRFSFVHLDLDIYRSTLDALEYVYGRMERGGFIVFDDYARPTTQGVKDAVNEFFADKPEYPIQFMGSCQAVIIKL